MIPKRMYKKPTEFGAPISMWLLVIVVMCQFEFIGAETEDEARLTQYDRCDLSAMSIRFAARFLRFKAKDRTNQLVSPIWVHNSLIMLMKATDPNGNLSKAMEKELSINGRHNPEAFSNFTKYIDEYRHQLMSKVDGDNYKGLALDTLSWILYNDMDINPTYRDELDDKYRTIFDKVTEEQSYYSDKLNSWAKSRGFTDSNIVQANEIPQSSGEIAIFVGMLFRSRWPRRFDETESSNFFNNYQPLPHKYYKAKNAVVLRSRNHQAKWLKYMIDIPRKIWKRVPTDSDEDYTFNVIGIGLQGFRETQLTIIAPRRHDPGLHPIQEVELEAYREDGQKLVEIFKELSEAPLTKFDITLPGLDFQQTTDLKPFFEYMGLKDLFIHKKAPLSEFEASQNGVKAAKSLKKLAQTGYMFLDKDGPVSATVSRFILICPPFCDDDYDVDDTKSVTVDSPFLFFITHDDIVMLTGRIMRVGSN